jgi:glycerol-3-phosphate dehydrogenase (NAD(P)+)
LKIAVLGAGAWGTALAISFSSSPSHQHHVTLWGRDAKHLRTINESRTNQRYLPDIVLPAALAIEADFNLAISAADIALIATSTAGLHDTATLVHATKPTLPIIWACKGFDRNTAKLPHETVGEIIGSTTPDGARFGALSGPSFALEVARGLPTALTLACNDFAFAQETANQLNGGNLRVYSNADLIGVELGGALKNVMAIAAGLCDGMALGMNARAAIITRGLAEMVRLGVAMGGKAETFMGLTGLGDLILTATGSLSRNRSVGVALAEGKSLQQILAELGHIAEGVNSAAIALKLAKVYDVNLPITEAVCALLFENAQPKQILKLLLSRETKAE